MKNLTKLFWSLMLVSSMAIVMTSCSKEDDDVTKDGNTPDETKAMVGGEEFVVVNPTSSTTGDGISMSFPAENGSYITITTNGLTSGTYEIGGEAGGRMQQGNQAWGYYFNGTATYSGSAGTITITVVGNSISGTYEFVATNQAGEEVDITGGEFADLTLQEISGPGTFTIDGEEVASAILCISSGGYNILYGYNTNVETGRSRIFYIYYITAQEGDVFLELLNFSNINYDLYNSGEWAAIFYYDVNNTTGEARYAYSNGGAISISRDENGIGSVKIGAIAMSEYNSSFQLTGKTVTAGCNLTCE